MKIQTLMEKETSVKKNIFDNAEKKLTSDKKTNRWQKTNLWQKTTSEKKLPFETKNLPLT